MPSVLVVDDTPVDRVLVTGLLKRRSTLAVSSVADAESALQAIESARPDLVVTDLLLPKLTGLDLVLILRERCPGLPVVLITAHGSEDLAVRAIAEGAASYVPKSQLAERLLATVEQVLEAAHSDRGYSDFQSCLQDARLRFVVGRNVGVIRHLTEFVCGMAESVGLCDAHDGLRLRVALRSLMFLGHYAGNREVPLAELDELESHEDRSLAEADMRNSEDSRPVRCLEATFELSSRVGVFEIRHEGPALPVEVFSRHSNQQHLVPGEYRGLVMLRAFADELEASPDGRIVRMVRRNRSLANE